MQDALFMTRALFLAGRARGHTSPNPLVGAVVVAADGRVVGAGFHTRAGEPHAEVVALREAGPAARGATLYCTLEPCCHYGRTPPCTDQIVQAGIARVVAATEDPNPRVAGSGFGVLRAHGMRVDVGPGRDAAERLNRPFFTAMRAGRPWVIAKIALSLDGRIAAASGGRTVLTSEAANRRSHVLRAEVDALGVGAGTVLADDPLLTCRGVYRARPLLRVIFDHRLRTPVTARVLTTLAAGPVVVVTDEVHAAAHADRAGRLADAGATVLALPTASLDRVVPRLLDMGVQALLLEGGAGLHREALKAGVVDCVRLLVTPRLLGPAGVPWVGTDEVSVPALQHLHVDPCGPDVIIEGDVYRTH